MFEPIAEMNVNDAAKHINLLATNGVAEYYGGTDNRSPVAAAAAWVRESAEDEITMESAEAAVDALKEAGASVESGDVLLEALQMDHGEFVIHSAELADLTEREDVEDFAAEYADAIRDAFKRAGLRIPVEVRHNVTGVGSGFHASALPIEQARLEDQVQDIADRVLSNMGAS